MFEIHPGQYVVYNDDPFIVVWTGGSLFRVFIQDGDDINEIDVFSVYDVETRGQAMIIADLHIQSTYCE